MKFGIIKKLDDDIALEEWVNVIHSHPSLSTAPKSKSINPVTKEEIFVSNIGIAFYIENNEIRGSIAL